MGASSQPQNQLNQTRIATSYFYRNTYGFNIAWQYTWGTPNPLFFPPHPVTGSANGNNTVFLYLWTAF
jgi:hypothetical protein